MDISKCHPISEAKHEILFLDEVQELFPSFGRRRSHAAEHATGDGFRRGLLHSTHDHAEMGGLHHNCHTERL